MPAMQPTPYREKEQLRNAVRPDILSCTRIQGSGHPPALAAESDSNVTVPGPKPPRPAQGRLHLVC